MNPFHMSVQIWFFVIVFRALWTFIQGSNRWKEGGEGGEGGVGGGEGGFS